MLPAFLFFCILVIIKICFLSFTHIWLQPVKLTGSPGPPIHCALLHVPSISTCSFFDLYSICTRSSIFSLLLQFPCFLSPLQACFFFLLLCLPACQFLLLALCEMAQCWDSISCFELCHLGHLPVALQRVVLIKLFTLLKKKTDISFVILLLILTPFFPGFLTFFFSVLFIVFDRQKWILLGKTKNNWLHLKMEA